LLRSFVVLHRNQCCTIDHSYLHNSSTEHLAAASQCRGE
jgi:hypothetical protein